MSVRSRTMLATFLLFSAAAIMAISSLPADEPALPVVATGQIVVRTKGALGTRTISGVIEDISGQTIVLRRAGNTVDVIRLTEVNSIRFQKSPEFEDGLSKLREQNWNSALAAFQSAVATERRPWVNREILAAMAQSQRAMGLFEECLQTVEQILVTDPDSRHTTELPLVWDERLPAEQRARLPITDLQSQSQVRQLTVASALLQEAEYEAEAMAALQALEKSTHGVLQELVKAQLWRIRLIHPEQLREAEINRWSEHARRLDRRTRSGPEFLIGRALLSLHDYDNAAVSFLWMPLLEPLDPPTTAASLSAAVTALESSGRTSEAARLRQSFQGP